MPILGASASGAKSSPVAPTLGTATNVGTSRAYNNGAATVTFTAPTSKLPITSYTVTSSPGGYTGTGASSPITVAGLQSATAYTSTVTATSSAGTSAASSASNSITATTVPQAPTIGSATVSSTTASVPFTAGATGGSAVTVYTATSSPGGFTGTSASSPISVSGLSYGTGYTFTVTATNANGTSTASSASNTVTPAIPYWLTLIDTPEGLLFNYPNIVGTATNAYTCGITYNSGYTQVGFLAKFDLDGTLSWSKNIAGSTMAYHNAVAVGSSGNIYVAGWRGATPVGHITKVDSSGAIVWTRSLTVSGSSVVPNAIAVDSSENVYVSGYSKHSSSTYAAGLIVKYNSSGTIQWQRNLYDTSDSVILYSIAVDASENVFVGGNARSQSTTRGYILAKYNSSGTIQWKNKGYTGSNQDKITALTCDSSGNVYAGGDASTGASVFLGKFDTSGNNSWVRQFNYGGQGDNRAYVSGVGIDSSGNITMGGQVEANSMTGPYAAIVKYNSSGTLQLNRTFGVLNTTSTGMFGFGVGSDDTFYAITNGRYLWHLPNDGTKTGTYSSGGGISMVYGTGFSITTSSSLGNFAATTVITDAAGQAVDAAGVITFATGTLTNSKTTI